MNRLITMQDISCIGKCSLTTALPVISAMGIEAVPLPTAVLSAHTMFHDVTFCDLTDQIEPIMKHWKKEELCFAGIYTGYLGSFKQLQLAENCLIRLTFPYVLSIHAWQIMESCIPVLQWNLHMR